MKTRFIFNPHSGHNQRNPGLAGTIRDFASAHRLDADLVTTEGPGHATELAREAVFAGFERIAAVGGDGTMNEVAQSLINVPAALALVPCGSGNGLARHLGLPKSILASLKMLAGHETKIAALDTGVANGFPFFNAMGLGLDADVSARFNRLTRRGLSAYIHTALAAVRALKSQRCRIVHAGGEETIDVVLVTVANSDQYGNNARIAPGARVDDGALDLVAVEPVGLLGALNLGIRLFAGTINRSPHVRHRRGAQFIVERDAPGLIHTDGETHTTAARVEISVRPRSLRMIVPGATHAVLKVEDRAPAGFALHLP